MAFSFDCFAVTHIGNHRKSNEDNFLIGEMLSPEEQSSMSQNGNRVIYKSHTANGTENNIFAVSDGMGGHKYGEVASYMVVNSLTQFITQNTMKSCRKRQDKFAYIKSFQEMVNLANQDILQFAEENSASENMGATLSGLIAFADEVAPVNIGDSSTFLFEGKTLRKLTTDDNEGTMFGEVSLSEIKANGKRLTKYFGLPKSSGILTATVSTPITLRAGQIFIIASDGLTDCLTHDDISIILVENPNDIKNAADSLIGSVLGRADGGRDNITIVMLMINK